VRTVLCHKLMFLLAIFVILGATRGSSEEKFFSDGVIVSGEIRLWENKRNKKISFSLMDNNAVDLSYHYKLPGNKWISPSKFKDIQSEISAEKKTSTFKAKCKTSSGTEINYNRTVKLLPDGKILFSFSSSTSSQIYNVLTLNFSGKIIQDSGGIIVNGYRVTPKQSASEGVAYLIKYKKDIKNIQFPSAQAEGIFLIDIKKALCVNFHKKAGKEKYNLFLTPEEGKIEFTIAFKASKDLNSKNTKDSYYGIDFWECNRMHMPNYRLCRNLIQNPSFEGGLRYYRYVGYAEETEKAHGKFYDIDTAEAKYGSQSLVIKTLKGVRPQSIGPFIIPVEPKKKYTFSFYAKGSQNKNLALKLSAYTASQKINPTFAGPRSFELTNDWKRYHTSFTSPNSGICLFFQGAFHGVSPFDETRIWVDGVQLEKGELTEYAEKPISAKLVSSSPDNFLEAKSPVNARLEITSKPDISGLAKISVTDFFDKLIWKGAFPFKANKKGTASIKLPLNKKLPKGFLLFKVELELKDGFKDTDYFRLNIMEFLEHKHKHRNFISLSPSYGTPELSKLFDRYKAIGAGSLSWRSKDAYLAYLTQKNGFDYWGGNLLHSTDPLNYNGEKITRKDIKKTKSPLPQEWEKKIEQACFEKAQSRPWIKKWWFIGEPNDGKYNEDLNMKDIVKLHKAAYKGIKQANSENEFISPGPWNIRIAHGLRWIDDFLAAGAKDIPFAAVDGHAYQTLPEDPDLDIELEAFIAILDKHGLSNTPIVSTEGIYHPPLNIPQWGSYTFNGGAVSDSYWGKSPSYHLGLGEKMQSAFHARHFIMALKYADRIKSYDAHGSFRRFLDVRLTPYALLKTINTIGQLLGNADFKRDIRFAPKVRCYVFEDNLKRPVAAIWSHIKEADRNLGPYPTAVVKFEKTMPQVFDLMEVPMEIKWDKNGLCQFQATSFPIFFRGAPDSLDSFCKAFENARLLGDSNSSVKILSRLKTPEAISISVSNILSRKTEGALNISVQNKHVFDGEISLDKRQSKNIDKTLPSPVSASAISPINITASFADKNQQTEKLKCFFGALAVEKTPEAIIIDGSLGDWSGIPEIPMTKRIKMLARGKTALKFPNGRPRGGKEDISAFFKMAWDEKNLYLAVRVVDDKFVSNGEISWNPNDSLQVFFDCLANARNSNTSGYDSDDYVYNFYPSSENSELAVQRGLAPERQLCGGLKCNVMEPGVIGSFKKTNDGYIYEIRFPRRFITPIVLEGNAVFGFNLIVNDSDSNNVKWQLAPENTEGYGKPNTYPVIILKK